jgi:hypothetical protein
LANMTADAANRTAAGRCGGVEAVIAVLNREDAADRLLEAACHALANMTDYDTINRKAAGLLGCVETVVAVLKREDAGDSLLEKACWALANMTADDEDNTKAAGRCGGVETVITVLRRADAADSLQVVNQARKALVRLVTDSSNLAAARRILADEDLAVYLKCH